MHRVLFEWANLTVYSYGVLVAAGVLLASALIMKRSEEISASPGDILDLIMGVVLAGLIGGRVFFIVFNWEKVGSDPLSWLMIWRGGLAVQGSLFFGLIAGWLIARRKRMHPLRTADLFAPYLALAQSLGRIGCFLNGCCYGRQVAGNCFGVYFPGDAVARIPIQLFYSAGLLAIFIMLRVLQSKAPPGRVIGFYFLMYSALRFLLDGFRGDILPAFAGLLGTHFLALIFFFVGVLVLAVSARRPKKGLSER